MMSLHDHVCEQVYDFFHFSVLDDHLCASLCLSVHILCSKFIICFSQGGKIRPKLVAELSGAKDVVIEEGTAGEGGKAAAQNGMRK